MRSVGDELGSTDQAGRLTSFCATDFNLWRGAPSLVIYVGLGRLEQQLTTEDPMAPFYKYDRGERRNEVHQHLKPFLSSSSWSLRALF